MPTKAQRRGHVGTAQRSGRGEQPELPGVHRPDVGARAAPAFNRVIVSVSRRLISAASFAYVALNLVFWSAPLLVIGTARVVAPRSAQRLRPAMSFIYSAAVRANHWWFTSVLGYQWGMPVLSLGPNTPCIVVSNHRSWTDIFLLQSLICRSGPTLTFLVKRELAYIPVLGLIFWAFDFPMLARRADRAEDEPDRRREDRARILQACDAVRQAPSAVMLFPEGTRFTNAKRVASESPHQHLLPVRPAGFEALCEGLRGHAETVVDVTISYRQAGDFCSFLSGGFRGIEVQASTHPIPQEPIQLLVDRWEEKDRALAAQVTPVSAR